MSWLPDTNRRAPEYVETSCAAASAWLLSVLPVKEVTQLVVEYARALSPGWIVTRTALAFIAQELFSDERFECHPCTAIVQAAFPRQPESPEPGWNYFCCDGPIAWRGKMLWASRCVSREGFLSHTDHVDFGQQVVAGGTKK